MWKFVHRIHFKYVSNRILDQKLGVFTNAYELMKEKRKQNIKIKA